MLLGIDVGNTNITFGVFQGQKLVSTFRMTTKFPRTSDEYGITIRDMLSHNAIDPEDIKDVIVSSVVPNVMHSLLSAVIKYLHTHAMVVETGTKTGIRISAKALWQDAAKLPEIEIRKPDSVLAKETISSMQVGLVYGQIGQTEYIVKRTKQETGIKDLKVVATGGLGTIIANETDCIDVYDPTLTLQGLRIIFDKQNHGKIDEAASYRKRNSGE